MSKWLFVQAPKKALKPRKLPRREAKAKFNRIMENLARIQEQHRKGEIQNAYPRKMGRISTWVLWHHYGGGISNEFQSIFIYDPLKDANAHDRWIPYGTGEERIRCTAWISKTAGPFEKAKYVLRKVLQSVVVGGICIMAGALAGRGILELHKSGISWEAFMGFCTRLARYSQAAVPGTAMIVGGYMGGICALVVEANKYIGLSRNRFNSRMMRFIRDPANANAVEALEKMR